MLANTCEIRVGCLLEIRVARGYRSVADVDEMMAAIATAIRTLPAYQKCVIAADWRAVGVMSPETSARAREMLSASNPTARRSAILTLNEQSTTNLQVQRLVREAENENRRHFTNPRLQHAWLSEVLSREESARLMVFLDLAATVRES